MASYFFQFGLLATNVLFQLISSWSVSENLRVVTAIGLQVYNM